MAITIALVGIGKIACDQHASAIRGNGDFELIAAASPRHRLPDVPGYSSIEALLDAHPELDAVSICTPPQLRYEIARYALQRGCCVMLEKPPCATLGEVASLEELARQQNLTVFTTWHSREAAAVAPARDWLVQRRLQSVRVIWKENVRIWHPGQTWIWQAGGLGVFDPGINALSILTRILPGELILKGAELRFPENCETPIAARLRLTMQGEVPIDAELDFRHEGPEVWNIEVETTAGRLVLSQGGAAMQIDGRTIVHGQNREYPALYARFAKLVREERSDVDVAPLRLVADAFLKGSRIIVEPFVET